MSAVIEYTVRVYHGTGRPPIVEVKTRSDVEVILSVLTALLDDNTYRIEIIRSES